MAPTISLDTLAEVCGGAGRQAPPPQKFLSLDASNGMLDRLAGKFGYKPRPGVINGTRVPDHIADRIGRVLELGAR